MTSKKYILSLFLLLFTIVSFSQGTITGILWDEENQEPLIGGIVRIEGTSYGAATDIDGQYSISVPAGAYTVLHTYIGYQDKQITDVIVVDGETNNLGQVSVGLGGDNSELDAVVVTAYVQKNSDEGLLNYQRNSSKILDAISAQSIAKSGDSDVAAVVKRISGVTIEEGKYVYVRGLGDRYSKSIVNGMELPGLDPERNTVQMDIFPSNIIDNIVVYKTFSPDLPGDFTGGMVDVITKDFPLEKSFTISTGLGYNSITSFSNNYLSANHSSITDALGFGYGKRQSTVGPSFSPNNATRSQIFEATNALNKNTALVPQNNFLNANVNVSYGNQFNVGKNKLGFTTALNVKNGYSQKDNWVRNDIGYDNSTIDTQTTQYRYGSVSSNEGLLNGLLNTAYKFERGKVGLKLLHTRTGETTANLRTKEDLSNSQMFAEAPLDYFQRSITNGVLSTDYYFGEDQDQVLDITVSASKSVVRNPERNRVEMFLGQNNDTYTFASNSLFQKEWRDLNEDNINAKANFEQPILKSRALSSTLQFGGAFNYKYRDFQNFSLNINPSNFFDEALSTIPNNDLNYILQSQNIVNENHAGYGINLVKIDNENQYNAEMAVSAGYVMTDLAINKKLKFIGGLRVENALMYFDGTAPNGSPVNGQSLNSTQFLPSANLVYEVQDYMNIRSSYNRTLARPSFKEKSTVDIYDAVQNQFFVGNINLVETNINNYDLRWEYFFGAKEMVSVSPFYKQFSNPIELSFLNADRITPINKGDADVLGFEMELRKDFGFIDDNWKNLSLSTNVTVVDSKIDFTPNELLKYDGNNAPSHRNLVGQAPYTINAGFSYYHDQSDIEATMNYNVKGKTLSIVGFSTQTYDVYEDPFHNLDFKLSKRFGKKLESKISISASNLINDNVQYYYSIDGSKLDDYQSYDIGQSFNVGYSINLN